MERDAALGRPQLPVMAFLISAVALGIAIVALAISLSGVTPQPRDRRGRFIKRPGDKS